MRRYNSENPERAKIEAALLHLIAAILFSILLNVLNTCMYVYDVLIRLV